MKVLVATEKPFAEAAVKGIKKITEDAGYEFALLEKYTDKSQLLDAVKDADALIIRSDKVDEEVFNAAKNLKIVVRAGAGYDNIDLSAATSHGVVAENTPGQNSNAVAELVFGLLVYTVRNFYNGKAGSGAEGQASWYSRIRKCRPQCGPHSKRLWNGSVSIRCLLPCRRNRESRRSCLQVTG